MRRTLCTAGLAMLILGAPGVGAAGVANNMARAFGDQRPGTLVQQVHSLYEAKQTLYGLGYYEVQVQRASLPYSFTACKRGVRYHIHVDYYGDLVEVEQFGACREYDEYDDDDYDYGYRDRRYRYRRYDY